MQVSIKQLRQLVREGLGQTKNIDCVDCQDCMGCNHCFGCKDCDECINCRYCVACQRCTDCIECSGQSGQRYMIGNEQLTQREYLLRAKELLKK